MSERDELLGRFEPQRHPDFVSVPARLANKPMMLRRATLAAFERMHSAAAADGVRLRIVSGTRTFVEQRRIWEAKWTGTTKVGGRDLRRSEPDPIRRAKTILTFSSMPGTSRHHWGTDIDLNALTDDYFRQGEGARVYAWLRRHAASFGFCQSYTPHGPQRPTGYNEEKWHWSYAPLAVPMLERYRTLIRPADVAGFAGAETAGALAIIDRYVNGVDPGCARLVNR